MVGAEEPRHTVDRQTLDLIDVVAAAVIARAGIALGVFVRQVAAHGLHDGRAREILGRDQLQMVALAPKLPLHGGVQLRVCLHQVFVIHIGNLRLCQNSTIVYHDWHVFYKRAAHKLKHPDPVRGDAS